jgi:prephenate dehydratase
VSFTLDALADRTATLPDLVVGGDIYLPVHHFLLGRRQADEPTAGAGTATSSGAATPTLTPTPNPPRAVPLARLDHVRRVYSHPQGFGQTGAFLGAYLRAAEQLEASSTSRAAWLAAQDPEGASAAISSEAAAGLYGLDVLARSIEDREDNTTRFFVLGRQGEEAWSGLRPGPSRGRREGSGREEDTAGRGGEVYKKTLVSFTVPHRSPGALADVLDCFRRGGLNLTSVNSVPGLVRPFQYLFFVEFEGSKLDNPEGRVERALTEAASMAESWRWLGSWETDKR